MKSLESFLFLDENNDKEELEHFEQDDKVKVKSENPARKASDLLLISATYDGKKRVVRLKLYDPKTNKIHFWYDNTKHLPYCLAESPLKQNDKMAIENHPGFDHFEQVKKYFPLTDQEITVTKIYAKDPLAIGGRPSNNIRDLVPKAWEARIRYYESYIYDRQISMGMPHEVKDDRLIPLDYQPSREDHRKLEELFKDEDPKFRFHIDRWFKLLESPVPDFKRVAFDIEVLSPVPNRIPDPSEASEKIIAASMVDSDGNKRILILERSEVKEEKPSIPEGVNVEFFEKEESLITEIFKIFADYPIVLTYNGDEFDLRYIYNRAERLNFPREQIPIELGRRATLLSYGVHIDLYRFFFNRSIQIYAFGQKYNTFALDVVAKSLINIGKVELETPIHELTYTELINYALRDAEITYKLTSFDDDLVMKLIVVLARISQLPLEDVTRQGVSGWIRSMMFSEHRRLNWLIPTSDELLKLKGTTSTKSIIEGKKYRGAIVVDPKPGIHFNVSVLDFASLYPSIIKKWNLSYETVLCTHPDCKDEKIPETDHWVCKKRKGISSLLIGSLRDLRVKWYKPRSKDVRLSSTRRSWYNVIQQSLKVILNASYGVFGSTAFSLYCPPVAESTAAIGRYAITEAINEANSLGIEVLYGDTDSIFIKSPTKSQIDGLIKWSNDTMGIELEVDKVYRYIAFSLLKKNYLGVYPDGRVDIKGLTGKKRHIPKFLKEVFFQVIQSLGEVTSPNEFESARRKIRSIVHSVYLKLKKREYSLEDLAFSIMLSKPIKNYTKTTPQHVKAAKLLVEAGYEVKPGEIIFLIKSTNTGGVKPLQLASIDEVDLKKYVQYMKSTLEQILDIVGLEFDEILGLTKLETFLWNK